MEVFGLLNLKRHSKSPTCGKKTTTSHHYYNLPKLKLDAQAICISIPEIFASFFVADRTSIIDVRHFDWDFSKLPYVGPVLDPSPSHLQLPPFFDWIFWYGGPGCSKARSVFHSPKNSGNSGWDVNGTWLFGSFHRETSGINGIPEKVVPFSRRKCPNEKFVYHSQVSRLYCFYYQFHTFRVLLSDQATIDSLEWNLWQLECAFPKRKFPKEIFRKFS